jgi:hypothetical protein
MEAPVDGGAECGDAEVPKGDPQLQGPAGACQLEAEIGEIDLLVGGLDVVQEVGRNLEAPPEERAVPD